MNSYAYFAITGIAKPLTESLVFGILLLSGIWIFDKNDIKICSHAYDLFDK